MDHNGLYTDLDSFSSITNCGTTNNSFNDTCPTLPSLNNFKYQQTNLSSNIYQQHDQQQHNHSAKSSLPQININNCNNNIFFPHDDGIFDANTAATTQCATANNQKNNFIGYTRKETGASGGGGDNITYNINNINTNIVNNINNPTNSAGGSDIFGGNQYHQINKNGETIINFTNNNLNGSGNSMPTDTVSATSQNFYGYQTNNNVQGQQTVYETSVQSQSSTFLDPKINMGTTNTGLYHGNQNPVNQVMTNGGYLPGNGSTEHSATGDLFSEYTDPLSTAKIITNFESKNPLKYPNKPVGSYYKGTAEYQYPPIPIGHLPPHNYPPGLYQHNGKIPPAHSYEPYPRISPRNNVPHYPTQPYPNAMDVSYSRSPSVPHPQYHLPPHPSHPPNNYGNFYNNSYTAMPYPSYPQMPYGSPLLRNESCSKSTSNYSKTGAVAMSPIEHNNFSMPHAGSYPASKKDFYNEFYPPQHFFEEQSAMNSCAKKSSRTKMNPEIYNPNGAAMYPDPHTISHHPQNGNGIRNVTYQPMPKHCSSYPMPSNPIDPYHNSYFYPYKNGEHPKVQKVNPAMSSKQFKNYSHFEQLPPHQQLGHYGHVPQYHTMQAKPPEKIKISIDLEEQINCSKIPKMTSYGYDPHHHYYQYHHHMPPRNPVNDIDPTKNPIANINISLRDFLSTWNEIDDDEETRQPTEDMERAIMREYNPMFVQKVPETFTVVPPKPTELESGIINEGTEKLYVLESIDVPLSELNKYKHLSVINKLPENVVINDKELYADDGSMKFIEEIDLAREKLYKSEFELEFEACQERKIHKIEEVLKTPETLKIPETLKAPEVPKIEKKLVSFENDPKDLECEKVENEKERIPSRRKSVAQDNKATRPLKSSKKSLEKLPKTKQTILKLKKEKILKASKVRITKRLKKYAINQRTSSVKSLQSICVDLINTSSYRKFAREQSKIIEKVSKMRILKDIKKKFNFEGMKKTNPLINQKSNHSVQINSLREICGNLLKDREIDEFESEKNSYEDEIFPTLRKLSTAVLNEMDIDVIEDDYLFSPTSLKDICEAFIYSNPTYFHIEEVSNVPKLQDLCKSVLSETNIFINIEENEEMFSLDEVPEEDLETNSIVDTTDDEPIYIVEENSGNVGELFESKNLNSFERSEILRKIQRVASIEDDEIFQAIGALHECDESIINNNDSNVSNKNIHGNGNFSTTNELFGLEKPEMSPYLSYMDDDLMHSVQYEEIVSEGGDGSSRNIVEILRHKQLSQCNERQTLKFIGKILKKALTYQRLHRFLNAKRRHRIHFLKQKAEAAREALRKQKQPKLCDTYSPETRSSTSEQSENESQTDAKDHKKAQTHQRVDDSPTDNCFEMIDTEAERNFPRLSSVLPSINEYKIDRKGSNRSDVKDICIVKKQKMTFDESLLSIDKIYGENSENGNVNRKSSSHSSRHKNCHRDERRHQSSHHISRHHSKSRNNTRKSYHSSSRQNFYTKDQMKHSEAKRLVIPSYKLYDKDLDIKLKTMPYVRIERVEKVDDMVKKYN